MKYRYPRSVGTRPADVCGWVNRPRSSSAASSFRTVADERSSLYRRTSAAEATGWAEAMYSRMTARSRSRCRSPSCGSCSVISGISTLPSRVLRGYQEGRAAVNPVTLALLAVALAPSVLIAPGDVGVEVPGNVVRVQG